MNDTTDKTSEILKKYGRKIRIIIQPNQGPIKAANKGVKDAKSEYVIKLDTDDYFAPNILKEMSRILDESPEIDFVYSSYHEKTISAKPKIVLTKKIFLI